MTVSSLISSPEACMLGMVPRRSRGILCDVIYWGTSARVATEHDEVVLEACLSAIERRVGMIHLNDTRDAAICFEDGGIEAGRKWR